jgi:pilus assembly protein CpaF
VPETTILFVIVGGAFLIAIFALGGFLVASRRLSASAPPAAPQPESEQGSGHTLSGARPLANSYEPPPPLVGLGPLEALMEDPEITEIMVNRYDRIFVERKGKIQMTNLSFTGTEQLVELVRRMAASARRRIDDSSPMVDARLPDGSRLNAVLPPLATSGASLTIRRFASKTFTIDALVKISALTREMADFLEQCVTERRNICVSGGSGSGKTTLLNVLGALIEQTQRIITIEDAAELKLSQPNVVSLEARPPNLEGAGEITIRSLVANALRMRPDRIIVGECRGAEVLDMLQAMNTGHDGSLTTLHANTPADAVTRLEFMVLMSGIELPVGAIRQQIGAAIDVIVQTSRMSDGTRKITHITAVDGVEEGHVVLRELYKFQPQGTDARGGVLGDFVNAEPRRAQVLTPTMSPARVRRPAPAAHTKGSAPPKW